MKSLRDQIDQKLKRINKAEGHKSLRRDNKGPLIVTSSIVDCLEGRERPKTIDSLRSKDTKKTEGKTKQRIASKYATSRLGHGNELMQTEDSDQPMRNVWNHGPSEASKREAEEIGNQLVDKILAQYGSHMSKRVDSDAFHRMRNYMNHRTQNNSSHQSIDEHEKIQKDDVSQKQFFSSDGFLDNDGDCFPKQYAPVAHSHKDIHDDEPTNNIKVRDVLQQVIRPQLALSGRKSLRQSERTLSNQSTLRNEVKIKDIVAKKQAINLYQSNGRSSFNPSISGQGSSLRHENISAKKQLSDVDSYASRFDETNERSIVDLNAKRVPVYTCVKGMPQSEKKQRILNGPVVGAFNGYSEQLITSNATHLVEKGNSFYNKTIQGQNNSSTSQYTSFGPNSMNPTKELSYVQYTQMHNKRISVVRSKCPPTNPKVTYSKLYTLKSQSYVKNPYIGPQHSESRLKLIN